jgi:cobalt-zinc-cadmium efflux system membrane fusion protein
MSTSSQQPTAGAPAAPRARGRTLILAAGAVAALAVGGAVVARQAGAPDGAGATARDVPVLEGNLIRFSPGFAERAGIALAVAEPQEVAPVVVVPGVVALDARRVAAVGARVPGRVREVLHLEGDDVRAGEVLAIIESTELGRAQAEVLKLRAREEAALADRRREEELAAARVSSRREAQAAEAAAVSARAERLAAELAVRALGGDVEFPGAEIGTLRLRTPIGGRVLSAGATRGKSLEADDTPFQVADLSRVWIVLSVFERDLPAVRPGDAVDVTPQGRPGDVLRGKVARVGDVISRDTRSAEVRVEVENPDRRLRPGESVTARIHGMGGGRRWVTVPADAVATVDGKPTLFVAREPTRVEIRGVTLGPAGEQRVAVAEGLAAGEQVVSAGVFALKSEIFR